MSLFKKTGVLLLGLTLIAACQKSSQDKVAKQTESASPIQQDIVESKKPELEAESIKVSAKFTQPTQFHGQSLIEIASKFDAAIAEVGDRFKTEDETAKFYAEAKDGETITYVELGIKSLGECSPQEAVSLSEEMLELVGISNAEWVRTTEDSGYVTYNVGNLVVKTYCTFEGDWYTVGVSSSE